MGRNANRTAATGSFAGGRKRSNPESQSTNYSPRKLRRSRQSRSASAGVGASPSDDGDGDSDQEVAADSDDTLRGEAPINTFSAERETTYTASDPVSGILEEQPEPLAFEDEFPAEAAIAEIFPDTPPEGASEVEKRNYQSALDELEISQPFLDYVLKLAGRESDDTEECFEMVALLVEIFGKGDVWGSSVWPIDVYLEAGFDYGSEWQDDDMPVVGEWLNFAKRLESRGASRAMIGAFAKLFKDWMSIGDAWYFPGPLAVLNLDPITLEDSMLPLKKQVWLDVWNRDRPKWLDTQRQMLDYPWSGDADAFQNVVAQFANDMWTDVRDGKRRPTPPKEWEFRVTWKQMEGQFAQLLPSSRWQQHFNAIRAHVEELFQRLDVVVLPVDSFATCESFCADMWRAIDDIDLTSNPETESTWQIAIGRTIDPQKRQKLKMRFATMMHSAGTGWLYKFKKPARPREHLWISLEKRLNELGMSAPLKQKFAELSDMSLVLAGNGIPVSPPLLRNGVQAQDYIFDYLEPAFVEPQTVYWSHMWNVATARNTNNFMNTQEFAMAKQELALRSRLNNAQSWGPIVSGTMTEQTLVAARARMLDDAASKGSAIWGPLKEEFEHQWEAVRRDLIEPENSRILAGRYRDLCRSVQDFYDMFGIYINPLRLLTRTTSNVIDFAKLARSVKQEINDHACMAAATFGWVAMSEAESDDYEAKAQILRDNLDNTGPLFKPWDPEAKTESDKDPRARGSGTDRTILPGRWGHMGHVGSGGFGQVSCWGKYDDNGTVIDRVVLKESYLTTGWDHDHYWEGNKFLRQPREFFIGEYLTNLPNSENIVKPKAYAIYDNLRMFRLYTEYCRHGDLRMMFHKWKGTGENVPTRMIWAVFEGLVSALCLMKDGCLPGGTPPTTQGRTYSNVMHIDIKDANIFLADKTTTFWENLPRVKLGDFGLALLESDPGSRNVKAGTQGWRAPEQIPYQNGTGVANEPTSIASDIWAVGLVILTLMNGAREIEEFTYLPGSTKPTFNQTAESLYQETEESGKVSLCDLVDQCLQPIPRNRISCTTLWQMIQAELTKSGLKTESAPPHESLRIDNDLHLSMTPWPNR